MKHRLSAAVRKRLAVTGVVQGVGFRPFVWRRARRCGLAGWVANDASGVVVEIEGEPAAVERFIHGFQDDIPPLAAIDSLTVETIPAKLSASDGDGFAILESLANSDSGGQSVRATAVPPDIATCAACMAELCDPGNRRHRYPFINCTDCGPRFSIIVDLPYDRPNTTMAPFALCPRCNAEYADPADRRFHAQPNACGECGPTVWFAAHAPGDPRPVPTERSRATCLGEAAIDAARAALRTGQILAIKGLGGFHLVCDATNDRAVGLLRDRKRRVGKPLAVMVADIDAARRIGCVDEQSQRLLESRERPIVLLHKSPAAESEAEAVAISAEVSTGNDFLGVMLPSTPLHHLLCEGLPPLVMTSGNLSEEPIVRDNETAASRLDALVDGFLLHDRDIHTACDDSVVRCAAGTVMPIRRSRGYAPLPIPLGRSGPNVLAVGGELKAALCLAHDDRAIMSQHIGDMGTIETLDSLSRTADHLMKLFRVRPQAIVADMHPGYLSTGWARRCADTLGIPLLQCQHHHAHVASLIAEHGGSGRTGADWRPLIGVCFDGTGYGLDSTIWGGEFFSVDGPLSAQDAFRRAAHLVPFPLPGGDAGIRHPSRIALALLSASGNAWDDRLPPVQATPATAREVLRQQIATNVNCAATSSMGRLFDAIAALAGVRQSITYEAEAAMNLEALAGMAPEKREAYTFTIADGEPLRIGWHEVVRAVVRDVVDGTTPAVIASRFHWGVAHMIAEVCARLRMQGGGGTVGLTGGVFQNAVLLSLTLDALHDAGFEVLFHHRVPANDGGLALGQAVLARQWLNG